MKTTNDYKIWENPDKCEIEITSRETLEKAEWIGTEKVSYMVDGVPAKNPWEVVVRSTNNGVIAVLPITSEGNIILTEEVRVPLVNENSSGSVVGMPAGLVDEKEDKKIATKREMQEEIGFESDDMEYVDTIASSEGMTDEEVDIFIAFNVTKVDRILDNNSKEVNGLFLSHEEGEKIKSIYSIPYTEIYDFLDIAREEGMKKGGKIDCALNHFERKFKDRISNN